MRVWVILRFSVNFRDHPSCTLALDTTDDLIASAHLARVAVDPLVTVCRAERERA